MPLAANDTIMPIDTVIVAGLQRQNFQMRSSQSTVLVSHEYLQQYFAGSLMQTLEGIPGVKAMSIGSGQSKPTIRGLGFNRMVVSEDGVKHEGQQWGDDHGLEIDQFAIDRAEVTKGPSALLYGSDAIAGVVKLYSNQVPAKPFEGSVQLFGRSNNEQVGLSVKMGGRSGKFFYKGHATVIDYADYKVPADSIQYHSYWVKLKDKRLRNTAGMERNGSLMAGYVGYRFHTDLRISDSYSKSGFFADAHGFEVRLSDINYDQSRRDIDLPYQWVNHLKVISHSSWHWDDFVAESHLAYQNNLREEHSEPISHGYMPQPGGSKERKFNKSTCTANLSFDCTRGWHELKAGLNGEYQYNRRSGWGFIIPDFENTSFGVFLTDRMTVTDDMLLHAGLRYDHAYSAIHAYHDWYETPVDGVPVFKQRSANLHRHFNSLTWSAGLTQSTGSWVLKANVGKSFRVPIAKELGTDGVNYHIFRYEKGNPSLDPEESYQLDASLSWAAAHWELQFDPYLNYFPNYIFLSPTYQYVEGLQLYHYTQARVLRYGMEAQLACHINRHWHILAQGEYLHARQKSGEKKGYTLPFSTPWKTELGAKYTFVKRGDGFVGLNVRIVGEQDEIVPPEKTTRGYWTLNLSAGKCFQLGNTQFSVAMHADNVLNKRYYDHTSFYRLIDVPEPGRNISLKAGLEF